LVGAAQVTIDSVTVAVFPGPVMVCVGPVMVMVSVTMLVTAGIIEVMVVPA